MDFFSIRFSIKVCQHVHGQYHQLHHPFNYGKVIRLVSNNLEMAIKLGPVITV